MTITPFRAGRLPGESTRLPDLLAEQDAATAVAAEITRLADVSEFQPQIDDATYLSWSLACVIRAAYGNTHDDRAWYGGQRRQFLHDGGIRFLGIYQYVVASQDIPSQVAELVRLVGTLRKGEKLIADIEEGSGNLLGRWIEWSGLVRQELGDSPWDYSGLFFAADHGLQPVNWVAAYGQPEPAVQHDLWQFTDAFQVPGVGTADCSLYHGTVDQLAALAYQGTPPDWTEIVIQELPTLSLGATGEDVRTLQGILVARHRTLAVDGDFGPVTGAQVRAFQASSLLAVDGIVGQHTWTKLLRR